MRKVLLIAIAGLAIASPASAQDQPKATPAAEGTHSEGHNHTDQAAPKSPELLTGYGNGGFAVTGADPQAQAFFSNGMELAAAFAHQASIKAMEEAVRLDPDCAMCHWGLAYAKGPTINYGADKTERKALYKIVSTADRLSRKTGTGRERDLIAALRQRFRPGSTIARRDKAYAARLIELTRRYPQDDTIAVLAADATIQAIGDDKDYKSAGLAASSLLETVLARSPKDTPAIHFYIHSTEIAGVPERAESQADSLIALAPNASHLVHMPSHTYYWVGRYQDAATVNRMAVELGKANAVRLGIPEPDGVWGLPYHSHNVIFGLGGAMMASDAAIGLELGRPLVDRAQTREKAEPFMQLLVAAGYFAIAQFDDPQAVLARPEPKLPYLKAAWHYARGEALAKQGDLAGVRAEIAAIPERIAAPPKKADSLLIAPEQMLVIVRQVLIGRVAMAERRWADAQAAFRTAAQTEETEDFSYFTDPPAFWYPVRRDLAAAKAAGGDTAGALAELEASLKLRPKDPVALAMQAALTK